MYNSTNKKFEIRNSGFRSSKSRNSFPFLKTSTRLRFFLIQLHLNPFESPSRTVILVRQIPNVLNTTLNQLGSVPLIKEAEHSFVGRQR